VQPTAGLAFDGWFLASGAFAGFGTAPLTGPIGAKPPFIIHLKSIYCHCPNPCIYVGL